MRKVEEMMGELIETYRDLVQALYAKIDSLERLNRNREELIELLDEENLLLKTKMRIPFVL